MINELPWMTEARKHLGLREVKGVKHNPTIQSWISKMGSFNGEAKAWWNDDETPWCGLFVGYVLGVCNRYVVKEWYRAKEWSSDTMTELSSPDYGSIAVLSRTGGGHVGFVVGKTPEGKILLLGGNQNDEVNISAFDTSRIDGYYWPSRYNNKIVSRSVPLNSRYELPILNAESSTKES